MDDCYYLFDLLAHTILTRFLDRGQTRGAVVLHYFVLLDRHYSSAVSARRRSLNFAILPARGPVVPTFASSYGGQARADLSLHIPILINCPCSSTDRTTLS